MGSALSTFTDFVASTGPSYLTSADMLINEVQKNSYIMRRFLKGADKTFVLQGGANIKDTLILDESSTFQQYLPNDTFTWSNPQVTSTLSIDWRFSVDHMSWTDQEIELNGGGGLSNESLRGVYKRLKREKEMRMWTSMINGWEDLLWRLPKKSEMEDATGLFPYSIPALLNEKSNGLFDFSGDAFTTIHGINPSTKTRWKPQTQTYTGGTDYINAATPRTNIMGAFDQMFYKVKFEAPPTKQEYFENPKLNSQFIACSRKALNAYQQLLRSSQDRFTGIANYQDPAYLTPQYGGIDLQYVAALDSAALYGGAGSTYYAEDDTAASTTTGPRYYWINGQYLCPVFHTSRYMATKAPMVHPNQPFTTVVVTDCWWNLVIRSRQRHGIVSPTGADSTGY